MLYLIIFLVTKQINKSQQTSFYRGVKHLKIIKFNLTLISLQVGNLYILIYQL